MADWSAAVLSTAASIAKIEEEINNLTNTDWSNVIDLSKELIGDRLEVLLTDRGYSADEAANENLLDVIANPTVFNLTSDYLVLSKSFEDLSQGTDGLYKSKSAKYAAFYEAKFVEDVRRMNLDTNNDDVVDQYRVNWQGKLSR